MKLSNYSESTKKVYWSGYLNFIADIEIELNKDLFEFEQKDIDKYSELIKIKSKQTILGINSFVNKYIEWYANFYKLPTKEFKLLSLKEADGSWYISKEDFFKMCNVMLKETIISNIIPLIFARYGLMGKQSLYMRNVKWNDIDYENKEVVIRNKDRKIISYIPVDDEFLKWINKLKLYEKKIYKNQKNNNSYIIKSQIEKDIIEVYASLNSKSYNAFNSVDREKISFGMLSNCAIVDYLKKEYENKKLLDNHDFKNKLSLYYPEENLTDSRLCKIKQIYAEVTGDNETLKLENISELKTRILKEKNENNLETEEEICSIENCNKHVYAKKLCRYHWKLQRDKIRQENLLLGKDNINVCKVENCNNIVLAKGYCLRHYNQFQKHGKITLVEKRIEYPKVCQIDGCNEKSYSLGYCEKHYTNLYKHNNPLYEKTINQKCNIENCENKYYAKGYCRKHYRKFCYKNKSIEKI
jgi:hypothetical protein